MTSSGGPRRMTRALITLMLNASTQPDYLADPIKSPVGSRQSAVASHQSEANGAYDLGRPSAVQNLESSLRVCRTEGALRGERVQPVLRPDEERVVAGLLNPAEAQLPADLAAVGVVLDVVRERDPGIELRARRQPARPGS